MNNKSIVLLLINLYLIHFSAKTFAQSRIQTFEKSQQNNSPFNGINFRNIGPTIMSGRITDIAVNPENNNELYVAYASGGVFHSKNNGQSFTPIFDNQATLTIGALAMDWRTHTLWVGTGEVNASRSSYAGVGVYKTIDTGKHWTYVGLPESHHIGKIIVNPTNDKIAYVAVLGHLYTPNTERGIYKTIDGGKTWKKTLYINDTTGSTDILMNENEPNILYATTWTKTRKAWNFTGNGEGSAIYKSIDAGETWTKITTGTNGFPQGKGVGRITLAGTRSNTNILYAVMDNNFNQTEKKEKDKKIKARDLLKINEETFFKLKDKEIEKYLRENNYPEKYTAENVKEDVRNKKYTIAQIAEWKLADADNNLFDTPIYGAELYKSDDAGKTWSKTHSKILEGLFYTYGYYFGALAVSPLSANKVIIGGYTCIESEDGGKTFKEIAKENCHADYHRIWINEKNDKHIIVGNDGGLNITYNNGEVWYKANNPAVGQFYGITTDNDKPYNIYGGLQDNGTWTASSQTTINNEWQQTGINPYKAIGGGDGMQVQVDTRDNTTTYLGYQFGNYYKANKNTGEQKYITPVNNIGEKPYRFNWQTPIYLSHFTQDIFYIGSNYIHRSTNKGDDMKTLSQDLTSTKNKGNIPFGTLTTIAESPLQFGLLYCGTDDGNIWQSTDVGNSWNNINNNLPKNLWVTRITPSAFNKNKIYCTLNGYRNDDFTAYAFVSNNAGKTWQNIAQTIPAEPVNVIKEDPKNENILYVGTDNGLYISVDGGAKFIAWQSNLPRVAIHDIAIQERENEIILGTHGRSIYITKLDFVQQYANLKSKDLQIFSIADINYNKNWGTAWASYTKAQQPNIAINYFIENEENVTISILNKNKKVLNTFTQEAKNGINTFIYDGTIADKNVSKENIKATDDKYYLTIGNYIIEIQNQAGKKAMQSLIIKESKKEEKKETSEMDREREGQGQ